MLPDCSQANPYVDMASLSALAKYTTGSVYYTPGFTPQTHAVKVQHEIVHNLTRTTGEPSRKWFGTCVLGPCRVASVIRTPLHLHSAWMTTHVQPLVRHALACCFSR